MYMQDTAHPLRGQPWTEIATLIAMQDPTLTEFQQFIRDRYHETDSARGPARTFLWFMEEVGELAEALAMRERGDGDDANLREEFADVLAWLGTLANITGVDLAEAVHEKYVADGGPAGTK
jgi:NTP pyrophosphatase (non-canonical NTP hydrolase)